MKKPKIVLACIVSYVIISLGALVGITLKSSNNIDDNSSADIVSEETTIISSEIMGDKELEGDILSQNNLPNFERMQTDDEQKYVNQLQVIKKKELLGLTKEDLLYPQENLESVRYKIENSIEFADLKSIEQIKFSGTTSKELQECINDNPNKIIDIQAAQITMNEGVQLKANTFLYGNGVNLDCKNIDYVFYASDSSNVLIDSFNMDAGFDYAFLVSKSKKVKIQNCVVENAGQKAICIGKGSSYVSIENNTLERNSAGAVYISDDTSYVMINKNTVCNNFGTSNLMAGIVMTAVEPDSMLDIWEGYDPTHHFPNVSESIEQSDKCPHYVIIENNYIYNNNSSGIYCDGIYTSYVVNNQIIHNDKEGVCLDYGSIGVMLADNKIQENGGRMRQTDEDLRMDYVLDYGRMDDGSAKSKLPGVSIDNSAYNVLINNIICNNYGGGIKAVRTGIRNLIMENVIKNNNNGQNDLFHFFGIELGSASAGAEKGLDFVPCYENIICRNIIDGNHWSGVYIGENGYVNDIFDNIIIGTEMYSIESVSVMVNSMNNNITSDIRNEYLNE